MCVSQSRAQVHRDEETAAEVDSSVKVLADSSNGGQLVVSSDVLFISPQYSVVVAVDITPSMLQVVSSSYLTHSSSAIISLFPQSNQTFEVKLDTAAKSLRACLQHLAQPVSPHSNLNIDFTMPVKI